MPIDGPICDRCGVRQAVATVRHVNGGRPPRVQRLCRTCVEEGRLVSREMSSPGLLEDFLAEFLGSSSETPMRRSGIDVPAPQPVRQVDITRYFSDHLRALLGRAAEDASGQQLDTVHVGRVLLDDDWVRRSLARIDVDADEVSRRLPQVNGPSDGGPPSSPLTPRVKRLLLGAFEIARQFGDAYVGPEHVLVALSADETSAVGRAFREAGVLGERGGVAMFREGEEPPSGRPPPSNTPTLDQYGRDLTALARDGRLDPVVGRDEEIEQTIEVLARRTKNNPVLIGDPGVGKTAIVEGIAQSIVSGDVPDALLDRRLVSLDLSGLVAGARYRGDFEERLRGVLEEVTSAQDELLLFIDEVHTVVGAGAAEGGMDAANMLKPALARGELHVIGATTLDEYRQHIERDAALERRFQPVLVDEPTVEEAVHVLAGLRDRYEAFHRVTITDDALIAAVELSDRYVTDRFLPDKAIDLVDQAAARVRLRSGRGRRDVRQRREELERDKAQAVAEEDYERAAALRTELEQLDAAPDDRGPEDPAPEVAVADIADVVSRMTGVPVSQLTQLERERLLDLEALLHDRVVGQDEAVRVVAEAVRRNRAGLGDPDRPVGSFLFLGPTGVGKTELARALAHALFGDDDLMIRLDMSEFQERHTVSRMTGAPPGYVGYEQAGQLTERVRRRPYSVLLLDEIEKAHPDVFNILLQILDDGRLTDSQGRQVDFRNTVVIMTSNLGADRLQRQQSIGFAPAGQDDGFAEVRHDVLQTLRRSFRPEFLNRIDEIVVFEPLRREEVHRIAELLLDRVRSRLAGQHIGLTVTDDAVAWIADAGFDPEFGARPLRRTIQRRLEGGLSRSVLDGALQAGQRAVVDVRDGELAIDIEDDHQTPPQDWEERHGADRHGPLRGPETPRLAT